MIASCNVLCYTPEGEHFGIVPVEAMLMSRPVVALDSGGPRETVLHGSTGLLCPTHPAARLPATMAAQFARYLRCFHELARLTAVCVA